MLALLIHAGSDRYVIDAHGIVEVVPSVPLRAVPSAPVALAGMLEYRGQTIPVVDLCRLLGGAPCRARLTSRITVCDLDTKGQLAAQGPSAGRRIGVLAEGVTRLVEVDPAAAGAVDGPTTADVPALGRLVPFEDGLVQLVRVKDLIPDTLYAELTSGNAAASETPS